jgi:uncharacterized transporter YbjL
LFAALRQQGVKTNVLAAAIVILAAATATLIGRLVHFDGAAVLGIFSGASTFGHQMRPDPTESSLRRTGNAFILGLDSEFL